MQARSAMPGVYPPDELSTAVTSAAAPDSTASGVSWGAVLAGAAAAAALSYLLVVLGFGLGLSAVSPWSYHGAAMGRTTVVWLALTQLAASGLGGYLAGRLRVKWASVHSDEVYFRDTAHGLLAWAVASLATAILLAGAVRAVVGGAAEVGAGAAAVAGEMVPARGGSLDYYADMLLRSEQAGSAPVADGQRGEIGKILANDVRSGNLSPDDRQYLGSMVAARTGLAAPDAEKRVDAVFGRFVQVRNTALANAEQARKAAASSALWMFVALLCGAFFASLCATFGGRQRDGVHAPRLT